MRQVRVTSWAPIKRQWLEERRARPTVHWVGFSLRESVTQSTYNKGGSTLKSMPFAANDSAAVCCRNKPFRHGRSAGWRHLNSTRHFALWCIERGFSEATGILFGYENEALRQALTEAEMLK